MVETQGEGAFNLDGASEPYNGGARHACFDDLTRFGPRGEKLRKNREKSGIVAVRHFG